MATTSDDGSDILNGPNGQLLVPTSRGDLAPLGGWPLIPAPGADALSAPPTLGQLGHCFRRRWPLAIVLGTGLGAALALAFFLLVPISYETGAILRINRSPEGAVPLDPDTFNSLRKTQAQLVKSSFVLSRALLKDEVRNLTMIQAEGPQADKMLEKNLRVDYPGEAELMTISLRGSRADELPKVVNAIVETYLNDLVDKEHKERFDSRERLFKTIKTLERDLTSKEEAFRSSVEQVGTSESRNIETRRTVLMNYVGLLRTRISEANGMVLQKELELEAIHSRIDRITKPDSKEINVPDDLVERAIGEDAEIRAKTLKREDLKDRVAARMAIDRRAEKSPEVLDWNRQMNTLDTEITERTAVVKPRIAEQIARTLLRGNVSNPDQSPEENLKLLESQLSKIREYISQLQKEHNEQLDEIQKLGRTYLLIEQQRAEIDSLKTFVEQQKKILYAKDFELQTVTPRIVKIEDARVPEGNNAVYRYLLVALGGLAGLGLAVASVVFTEAQSRRVNHPNEIGQGLGVKVLGVLPARRQANAELLSDSIDSVRTMMLKGGGPDAPHLVMVTSAVAREGKTTVASQLAASLSRAGRRTLLIDGDVRQPTIHQMFSVGLENGLCEVLRREIDVDDAVHASAIPELWVMTAGFADHAAIMALSRDGVQEVFRRLRAKFDCVVIDTGPVLTFADSLLLGHFVDAAILSVRRDLSQMSKVQEARERLEAVGVRVLGAVVNCMNIPLPRELKRLARRT